MEKITVLNFHRKVNILGNVKKPIQTATVLQLSRPKSSKQTSVSDPFHYDLDPDPRIRFEEKRIRIQLWIRPKIEKIQTF